MLKSLAQAFIEWRPIAAVLGALDRRSENRMTEFGMLSQAFEFVAINKVYGDYFEFGLWRGKTFCYAHKMKRRHHFDRMMMWGFDSFAGLPEIASETDNIWQQGEFSCSKNEFVQILSKKGVGHDEYGLVDGYYKDSLNEDVHRRLVGRTAAVVYIDCDLYESTTDVLRFLPRYLVNGTVICFDDYYCYKAAPDQGEQRAIAEFLTAHSQVTLRPYFDYGPVGKSFIVRLRESTNV